MIKMHLTRGLISLCFLAVLTILPVIESVNRRTGVDLEEKEPQGSLRGVLRALERRRRTPTGPYPLASFQDHEDPQDIIDYLESRNDYQTDPNGRPVGKTPLLNYLDKEEYPLDDADPIYKSTVFRERNDQLKEHYKPVASKKSSSAFRERESKQNNYQMDDLQELFLKNLVEREEEEQREESDAEYAELLRRLWEKYKYTHPESYYNEQRELLGPYKERNIRKRQIPGDYIPGGGWGPIAFKKKRSSKQRVDTNENPDFLYSLKFVSQDPAAVENLKDDKLVDEEEDPDISKIININGPDSRYNSYDMPISQPLDLDDDSKLTLQPLNYPSGDEVFLPDGSEIIESPVGSENLYPITKRSNSLSSRAMYNQRFAKRNLPNNKMFRSSVTDPKVMKDLSSIFGSSELTSGHGMIQKPVKRSNPPDDDSHESKSPTASARSHHLSNESHENTHNDSSHEEHDHDHGHSDHEHEHPHSRHEHENKPPLLANTNNGFDHSHEGNEKEVEFEDTEETHIKMEHPIILKKKSIDWSKYFGIDKRKKKSLNYGGRDYVEKAKRLMNSYSLQNFRNHDMKDNEEENTFEDKRKPKQIDRLKLDSMDNKLKNMETAMVDEALEYEGGNDGLDTKEEQEMKEKILSRLAAAYSLDKMRKALKDFKLSLQAQKISMKDNPHSEVNEDKEKRIVKEVTTDNDVKHELDPEDIKALEDNLFENEQGAGHFLNGPVEVMSEGYMGGNGLNSKGLHLDNQDGTCPILDRIVRKCHNIDILAGDHGQLFLPLCSLHQICYLCGPSSPTGCDLMFLSEADSACSGRPACQRAARGALMALRDLHAPLAHHLQGECSRDTCLARSLQDNKPWHQPFRR